MSLFVDDMIIYVENPKELTNKLLKLANHIANSQDFCCCSVTKSCPTLCDPMNGSTSGFPVLHYLPEFTHVHWVSDVSQPSHPLLLLSPLALNLSNIRVFSNESGLGIRWPKYWSFNFSISSSKEYSGLISLRIDWLDLHAIQGTLKSFFRDSSSKASIL